jgi:hypothetical protein
VADPSAQRTPDLVKRRFRVEAPNRLLVADFTYVRLASGLFVYTAFVIDAYAGRIVGWECSTSKHTRFVESAIRQAAALRAREGNPLSGNTIHHSDAGSQLSYPCSKQQSTVPVTGRATVLPPPPRSQTGSQHQGKTGVDRDTHPTSVLPEPRRNARSARDFPLHGGRNAAWNVPKKKGAHQTREGSGRGSADGAVQPVELAAIWLAHHPKEIRTHEAVAGSLADIEDAVRWVRVLVDRPADRSYVGPCTAEREDRTCAAGICVPSAAQPASGAWVAGWTTTCARFWPLRAGRRSASCTRSPS